jgi:hypothetical protein
MLLFIDSQHVSTYMSYHQAILGETYRNVLGDWDAVRICNWIINNQQVVTTNNYYTLAAINNSQSLHANPLSTSALVLTS